MKRLFLPLLVVTAHTVYGAEISHPKRKSEEASRESEAPDLKKFKPTPLTPPLGSSPCSDAPPSPAVMDKRITAVALRSKKTDNSCRELKERVNKHSSDIYETKREFNKKISKLTEKIAEQSEEIEKMRKENETLVTQVNATSAVVEQISQNMTQFLMVALHSHKTNPVLNLDKPKEKDPLPPTQTSEQRVVPFDVNSLFIEQ